ncbi:hypothetical protein J437_LFUL012528 [Ladona fulva]|uniref:pyridoxal 5'-phosphate synthase n=1 Tax=Ladona fulva TaxID=123851 RepID=A0A8K0P1L1_LADFU|nr:hypothetical protein J437_LFUL012528 [Ladona fulva]
MQVCFSWRQSVDVVTHRPKKMNLLRKITLFAIFATAIFEAPITASETPNEETSNLVFIDVTSNDPMDLFREWFEEAKAFNISLPHRMSVSSASSDGDVTSRSLLLRQLDDDGFVIMTDSRSLKAKHWQENPRATFAFFWGYKKGEREIARQIRIQGDIIELPQNDYAHLYNKEPLYCKIRSHICHQGVQVEWKELKAQHDRLLQEYKDGLTTLPIPEHVIFYKLQPKKMDFYAANEISIGDRVLFERNDGVNDMRTSWRHHHLSA